jgi:phage terminase Nu1 subunit (DNA packaging protein)
VEKEKMATIAEVARHLDLGERRLYELLDLGAIKRATSGAYDLASVRVQYLRHLRRIATGRGAGSDFDLAEERAKLTREQTESAALKNMIARGEYVLATEAERQVAGCLEAVRRRGLAIATNLAPLLEGLDRNQCENLISVEISAALDDLFSGRDIK